MEHYKVVVYAISKNEEKFARRWAESMSEADEIIVLDTGSEDNTPSILREMGVKVTEEVIFPWRFDTARNRSLALVPEDADICVCVDLDEVFRSGWRKQVEQYWRENAATRLSYRYVWSFREDGSEGVVFWIDKIHTRHGYRWVNPVHEVLSWEGDGQEGIVMTEGIQCEHYPDPSKSRGQYLPLLELAVAENPDNDRNMHYLGREYMFHGKWEQSIDTLKRHLALPSAQWKDERCASMRFIARDCQQLGRMEEAESWLLRAAGEAPYLREPWTDLANFYYTKEDWNGVLYGATCALSIQNRPRSYICEAEAWGSLPDDLCALGFYYTNQLEKALHHAKEAVKHSPQDERLRENLRLIYQQWKNS